MSDSSTSVAPASDEAKVPNRIVSERQFEDGPWAIKWIAGSDKKTAFAAAKRKRMTMGEWLGEAIRAYVEAEREDTVFDLLPPEGEAGQSLALSEVTTPLSVMELAQAVALAEKLAQLRGKTLKPRGRLLLSAERRLLQLMGS